MPAVVTSAACSCLLLAQDPLPPAPLGERFRALGELQEREEWGDLASASRELRGDLRRSSDAWFAASFRLALADWRRATPEAFAELEALARESLDAAADIRRHDPRSSRSALGPFHPSTARSIAEIEILLSLLLQARGHEADALGHLRLLLDDLQSGRPMDELHAITARAGLAAANALQALGRANSAWNLRRSLAEEYGEYVEGSVAAVLLSSLDGEAYSGRFAGDPEHASRLAELPELVVRAREELVERLGWGEEEVSRAIVGVADDARGEERVAARTHYDPRRPQIPPVVVVSAEVIAVGDHDLERILVHELAHVALSVRFGISYERWPAWLREGVALHLAEQLDDELHHALEARLLLHGGEVVSRSYWKMYPPPRPDREEPLLVLGLSEAKGGRGIELLVERALAGDPLEVAFRSVAGLGPRARRAEMEAVLLEKMQRELEPSWILLFHLARAAEQTPRANIEYCREVLQDDLPPIGEAFARLCLAESLVMEGRLAEAATEWGELFERRREHPMLTLAAARGRAECLLEMGRELEARPLLELLEAAAPDRSLRKWASERLREIAR